MPKFKFSKLVRDNIVDLQLASGAKPSFRILDDNAHKQELVNKIIEEAKEITRAKPSELAGEIADVQQALDDLRKKYGLSTKDIAAARAAKNKRHGPFKKGVYIDYVVLDENDKWVAYYRKHADRYPQID